MSLVNAIWVGPFTAELPDGRSLQPGDSAQIPEADLASAHWTVEKAPAKPTKGAES